MKTKLVDWIVSWMVGAKISGWHTKLGAAVTILLAVSSILLVVAKAIMLVTEGHYSEAAATLDSPELWLALGALGITKQMLGQRHATDKAMSVSIATAAASAPEESRAVIVAGTNAAIEEENR